MTWSSPTVPGFAETLALLARRAPQMAFSTGLTSTWVTIHDDTAVRDNTVVRTHLGEGPGRTRDSDLVLEPCDLLQAEVTVRVPYPGFLNDIESRTGAGPANRNGDAPGSRSRQDPPAWEWSRYRGYRRHLTSTALPDGSPRPRPRRSTTSRPGTARANQTREAIPPVYPDMLVLRFSGWKPHARLTVPLTEALRSAMLGAAGDGAPTALHGHGADGRPHVAFLALPDAGGPHADGHLLGLAIAIPDLPAGERETIHRAFHRLHRNKTDGHVTLRVAQLGVVELRPPQEPTSSRETPPNPWRRNSRRWVSATPVVLDRYPKRPDHLPQLHQAIRTTLRSSGLPEPVDLRVSTEPLTRGAARLKQHDLPAPANRRLFRHVDVTFDRDVTGPVLAGAGRYLGVGLFAPITTPSDAE
jgi:CRISPR-associated protein Csb2